MPTQYPPGFAPGHEPLKKIARRKKNGGVADNFPTRKYVGEGSIRTSSPLVSEMLMHLDANPAVRRISSYPIKVTYEVSDRYGPIGVDEGYPELGVMMNDGSLHYLDVIPLHHQSDRDFIRAERMREVLVASYDASYCIKDEREIFREPRMSNLRNVWMHWHFDDPVTLMNTRIAVESIGFPTAVSHVCERVGQDGFVWRDWNRAAHNLAHTHPVFSALKHLHVRGDLSLDLSRPLGFETVVRELFSTPNHSAERRA